MADALSRSLGLRCRRRWCRRSPRGLSALSTGGPDLVADLIYSGGTHFVENRNYIAVHRHQVRADRNFNFRICSVKFKKAREHLIVAYNLIVESNYVALTHLD